MKTLSTLFTLLLTVAMLLPARANSPEWINLTQGTHITSMVEDANNLWIGTKGGLVKMDKQTQSMTYFNKGNSGLPSNSVEALDIDAQGNIWIGTYDQGLAMYDGTNWQVFNKDNSGLPSNQIYTIQFDNQDNLWIGELFYLIKFDGQNFTNYDIQAYAAATTLRIYAPDDILIAWNAGSGTASQMFHFDGDTIVDYTGFYGSGAYKLYATSNGDTWLCFDGGVAKRDGSTWRYFDENNSALPNSQARSMSEYNGVLYLGTDDGVYKYENNTWQVVNDRTTGVQYLLANDEGLWIGTENDGLKLQNGAAISSYHTSNSNVPFNTANGVQLAGDKLWFSGYGGDDLYSFDGSVWSGQQLSSGLIYGAKLMAVGLNNDLWVFSSDTLFKVATNGQVQKWSVELPGISYLGAHLIKVGPDGKVYIATYNNGFVLFDGNSFTQYNRQNSGLSSSKVQDFAFSDGKVFIATYVDIVSSVNYGGGVEVWDGNTFTRYYSGNSTLPSNYVKAVLADDDGVWAMTEYGLAHFKNNIWSNYSIAQLGMPVTLLQRLKMDMAGNLWVIGTNANSQGILMRWDGASTLYSFDENNSPISDYQYGLRGWDFDEDNNLWLAMGDGLYVYKEGGVTGVNETLPGVVGIEDRQPQARVTTYPNPVVSNLNFNWTAEVQGNLNLQIYDLNGALTVERNLNVLAGERSSVPMDGLNAGCYIYQVRVRNTGTLLATGKLLKSR